MLEVGMTDQDSDSREPQAETAGRDLTEAEARIAPLVARGLSNKEIAHKLGISGRTVEMHISHILAKKGWSNRIEIARHVFERDSLK
ncbi:MAG: helix-turn-helix transcriptional regulator [Acidobacteriota bacterium]|nr:helix-turn-helix transcriptional regulator [Acidobacteriota bacterium]